MNTEEWKMISNEAKLLISKMLEKDPLKVIYYIINIAIFSLVSSK